MIHLDKLLVSSIYQINYSNRHQMNVSPYDSFTTLTTQRCVAFTYSFENMLFRIEPLGGGSNNLLEVILDS